MCLYGAPNIISFCICVNGQSLTLLSDPHLADTRNERKNILNMVALYIKQRTYYQSFILFIPGLLFYLFNPAINLGGEGFDVVLVNPALHLQSFYKLILIVCERELCNAMYVKE